MNPQMLIMLAVMVLAFWGLSRFSRSQQKKMLAEQERRTNEALVPGNWVRTRAGSSAPTIEALAHRDSSPSGVARVTTSPLTSTTVP